MDRCLDIGESEVRCWIVTEVAIISSADFQGSFVTFRSVTYVRHKCAYWACVKGNVHIAELSSLSLAVVRDCYAYRGPTCLFLSYVFTNKKYFIASFTCWNTPRPPVTTSRITCDWFSYHRGLKQLSGLSASDEFILELFNYKSGSAPIL